MLLVISLHVSNRKRGNFFNHGVFPKKAKLGKHKTPKSDLCIIKLSDIDEKTLKNLIGLSLEQMLKNITLINTLINKG